MPHHEHATPGALHQLDSPAGADDGRSTRPGGQVHFQNRDAARAAHAAPVTRGDPGYGPPDGDGMGCENPYPPSP